MYNKELIEKWLQPPSGAKNVLFAFTGGVETTLMAYMACKYYENTDVNVYFYTVNVIQPAKLPWEMTKDQYSPETEVGSASTVLSKVRALTSKKFTHLCRYHTSEEVEECMKEHKYKRAFDVTRHFDIPYAMELYKSLNADAWYSGRNRMFSSAQVKEHVNYLEEDSDRVDILDEHAFAKLDRPIVQVTDEFTRITPFLDVTKDVVIDIYKQLDIVDLYKQTLSCPYPYDTCYGKCGDMIKVSGTDYKTNCFERLTAESICNIK